MSRMDIDLNPNLFNSGFYEIGIILSDRNKLKCVRIFTPLLLKMTDHKSHKEAAIPSPGINKLKQILTLTLPVSFRDLLK